MLVVYSMIIAGTRISPPFILDLDNQTGK